jgi:hypothetical protein
VHKDIGRVARWLDAHMLGVFVKSVLRVVSYLDVVSRLPLETSLCEAMSAHPLPK